MTLNIRNYSLRYKTVLLSPPALAFLQIHNKDNDDVALLAPPRPWRRRKCFAVVAAIIICSKGSRPVVNDKRTSGEGASSSRTPFAALLVTNCVICRRGAPSCPWRRRRRFVALALIAIHRSGSRPVVNGENRWRRGRFGVLT